MAGTTSFGREFTKGLWDENAVIKQLLGLCPALAVSNSAVNGLAMGLATWFVVLSASIFVSLIKNVIPKDVRIPVKIIIIAGFVTVVDIFLKAQFPALSKSLGPYIPLIVVNCLILGRAESFASHHSVGRSVIDATGTGVGFTWVLVVLGAVREILGMGSVFGVQFLTEATFTPWIVMILPGGAFLSLGLMIGIINYVSARRGGQAQ